MSNVPKLFVNADYYIRVKDPGNRVWLSSQESDGGCHPIPVFQKLPDTNPGFNKWRVWKVLISAGNDPTVLHYGDVVYLSYSGNPPFGSVGYDKESYAACVDTSSEEDELPRVMICSNTTFCKLDYSCFCEAQPRTRACECLNPVAGPDYGKPVCFGQSVMFCLMPQTACSVYLFYDRRANNGGSTQPAARVTSAFPGCAAGNCPTSFELIPVTLFACAPGGTVTLVTDFDSLELNCAEGCQYCYSGNSYVSPLGIGNCNALPPKPKLKYYTCCVEQGGCVETPTGIALDVCQKRCVPGARYSCTSGQCIVDPLGNTTDASCGGNCPTESRVCGRATRLRIALYSVFGAVLLVAVVAVVTTLAISASKRAKESNQRATSRAGLPAPSFRVTI